MSRFYDFTATDADGNTVSMSDYEGKVLLIINTATGCGFTPQYEGLQALYEKYADQGFEVLDFPCNQFGNQAPGTDEEIVDFCQSKYGTTCGRKSTSCTDQLAQAMTALTAGQIVEPALGNDDNEFGF